jgi:superfamily II DNA or RNA helicase
MPKRTSKAGSELFIVDNSDEDWKVLRYLHEWCQISKAIDIATGYFEIGSLLALKDEWQKVDQIRVLMGDEVTLRTKAAFAAGLANVRARLDASLEAEKQKNDFLMGVPAVVEAIRSGKIACRVYKKEKFHAKAYITHARLEVVGSSGLVGSSNFTYPGLTENIELNVQITGRPVTVLQEWYEEHWNVAEDVTPEVLRVIERHTREYTPFEVYVKALHELHRRQEPTDAEWFEKHSRVYRRLDKYQKDGFHNLLAIARNFGGALLCDGVGLGKTFIGMMLMEYLIEHQRKRVVLFVPKAGRKPVWERALNDYAPHLFGAYSGLEIFNHTDLSRGRTEHCDYPELLKTVQDRADVVVIDEAHHFRNLGYAGTGERIRGSGGRPPSRYHRLYELIGENKQVFLLTATPVNNRLTDLQHVIELFSRRQADHFKALGIQSLPGHIRRMEKELVAATGGDTTAGTDLFEAAKVLAGDTLFHELVVQRSRAFVRESQKLHGGSKAVFPERASPQVAAYDAKKTYGKLLGMVEAAFAKEKPLFALAIYNPYDYLQPNTVLGPDEKFVEGRSKQVISLIRTQFLKRFESSAYAFEQSCNRLLKKLLAFATRYATTSNQKRRLEVWQKRHAALIGYVGSRQLELFPDEEAEQEADEDFITDEMLEEVEDFDPEKFDTDAMFDDTLSDLEEIGDFLEELQKFQPKHDDKLAKLIKLLKTDKVLKQHKVLIFTEFAETARYLKRQLDAAGIDGVDQVDSGTKGDRGEIIRRFAPYYNGATSGELAASSDKLTQAKHEGSGTPPMSTDQTAALRGYLLDSQAETRVLISTDVLSEGLNLQDATRLINYDLHWNPVRLMQRIGRVDRRLNPDVEARLLADHPEQKPLRGTVAFWNFLPPEELNALLTLYSRVTHKTLRISKTFGIEGKQLLTPEDDYEALKNFNHEYEGELSPAEKLETEYDRLVAADPGLPNRLAALPGRVFSGKRHPAPGTQAVFFCFVLPAVDQTAEPDESGNHPWTEEAGRAAWYLYDLVAGTILDDPARIADVIRCQPDTPRHCEVAKETLSDIRGKVEKHIRNTYLKSVQAPVGVKPVLKAWLELN